MLERSGARECLVLERVLREFPELRNDFAFFNFCCKNSEPQLQRFRYLKMLKVMPIFDWKEEIFKEKSIEATEMGDEFQQETDSNSRVALPQLLVNLK